MKSDKKLLEYLSQPKKSSKIRIQTLNPKIEIDLAAAKSARRYAKNPRRDTAPKPPVLQTPFCSTKPRDKEHIKTP